MKNENAYILDFDVWKENAEVWKERDGDHFAAVVGAVRLGQLIKFAGYGNMSYEEDDMIKKWHPKVTLLDSYNRKLANCLVFNVVIPGCKYDKIFVYYNTTKAKGHTGYYIHSSTNPKEHIHKYYIENDMNRLMLSINSVLYKLDRIQSDKTGQWLEKHNMARL